MRVSNHSSLEIPIPNSLDIPIPYSLDIPIPYSLEKFHPMQSRFEDSEDSYKGVKIYPK